MNLFLIPARGGSKGLPGKNIRPLLGKALILHSLDFAKSVANENDIIYLSTDDETIRNVALKAGYTVPELRPPALATDESPTEDTIKFTIENYLAKGIKFDKIVLLQPTTPFRNQDHFNEMMNLGNDTDMVVSVCISKQNPYFNLFEESASGYLHVSKAGNYKRRQDCPEVYQYNGSIYIIDYKAFLTKKTISAFDKVRKYVMDSKYSIDIDTELDFKFAELTAESISE